MTYPEMALFGVALVTYLLAAERRIRALFRQEEGLSSTFLGVLAGLGLKMCGPEPQPGARRVELLNPNARIQELLENLGVLDLFAVVRGTASVPEAAETTTAAPTEHSREELARTSLEAHQTLMAVNPENIARFKDVTQFLAEDLKKLEKR